MADSAGPNGEDDRLLAGATSASLQAPFLGLRRIRAAAAGARGYAAADGDADMTYTYDDAVWAKRCGRCGWATLPFAITLFLTVLTVFIVWFMVASMNNLNETIANVRSTSQTVDSRVSAYATNTDELMKHATPEDIGRLVGVLAQALLEAVPSVGARISALGETVGAHINFTSVAFLIRDTIDMLDTSVQRAKQRGLTVTLMPPTQ